MNFYEINERIDKAYSIIKQRTNFKPKTAIILGSGLSAALSICHNGITVDYNELNSFPISTVEGHKGSLKMNENLLIFAGRFHYYEGYHPKELTMPVLLAKKLGIENLITTNAAGAINPKIKVNDFVLIKDHINFMGINPLIGMNDPSLGTRFTELTSIYKKSKLKEIAKKVYKDIFSEEIKEGIYLAVSGPTYETSAEVKMFRAMGADLVGMSTITEIIMAAYLSMQVLGISNITNLSADISINELNHEEITNNCAKIIDKFIYFLEKITKELIVLGQ